MPINLQEMPIKFFQRSIKLEKSRNIAAFADISSLNADIKKFIKIISKTAEKWGSFVRNFFRNVRNAEER